MAISRVNEYIRVSEGIDSLTRQQLDDIQLSKLNDQLARLHLIHPLSRYPRFIPTLNELADLPFTTEDDITERPGELLAVSQSQVARIITDLTSGSSDEPKRIFYTQGDRERTRLFFSIGLRDVASPGDVVLIGFPESGELGLTELIHGALDTIGASCLIAADDSEGIVTQMKERKPKAYIGHPHHARKLITACRKENVSIEFKEALISGGIYSEILISDFEEIMGKKPHTHYGSREIGLAGALSCECNDGMHVRENDLIVEIVDEKGNRVEDGEYGEIVITTLSQEAMPLIRYKTKDWGRLIPQPCKCGCISRRLDSAICRL